MNECHISFSHTILQWGLFGLNRKSEVCTHMIVGWVLSMASVFSLHLPVLPLATTINTFYFRCDQITCHSRLFCLSVTLP